MAGIGQFDGLERDVLHIIGRIEVVHERQVDLLACGEMERLRGRSRLGERVSPSALEIDRVGQDQPGGRIQASRWQDVLNLVFSLLGDPAVDFAPGSLGAGLEISQPNAGLVFVLAEAQEGREEGMALVRPQGIGDA